MQKNNKPVIEQILRKVLEDVLKDYPTKQDLDNRMQVFEERMEEKSREFRDDIWNKIDSFMGRVVQVEENQEVGDHQVKEQFADHEERIAKLEQSQTT